MVRSTLRALWTALIICAVIAGELQAQAGVAEGVRVRVSTDRSAGLPPRVIGTLTHVTPETLVVANGPREVRVGRERIRGMQVSAGRRPAGVGLLRGAGLGFLAGAGVGAVAGYATHEESFLSQTHGQSAAWGALAGALIGIPLGGIIGAAAPGERWNGVDHSRVSVVPHRRGGAIAVSVSY